MTTEFRVGFPAPLDIAASLELFRRSGDDLIDRWDGTRVIRAVPFEDTWIPFTATPNGDPQQPAVDVTVDHASRPSQVDHVRSTVERMFFEAPPDYAALLERDEILARLDAKVPGIRQIRQLDLFSALVRCISAQQVNLRWAVITRRRLAEAFGTRFNVDGQEVYCLDPARIAHVDPLEIRALQFTMSKSVAIVATARALLDQGLNAEELAGVEDEAVVARLIDIRGIGRWSAEWVLARTLGRPRVVAGDLGVRKAVGLAYLGKPAPTEPEVRQATAHWGDSAGVAQAVLLHTLGEGLLSPPPAQPVSRAAFRT